MNVSDYVFVLIAVYNIVLALTMHTENFISAVIFKVIPFFIGLYLLYFVFLG